MPEQPSESVFRVAAVVSTRLLGGKAYKVLCCSSCRRLVHFERGQPVSVCPHELIYPAYSEAYWAKVAGNNRRYLMALAARKSTGSRAD